MEVEAVNEAGAKTGDRVLVSLETASLIKVFFVIYIFPIVAMLAGALIGQHVAPLLSMEKSLAAVIGSFLFFLVAFRIIRIKGNRMAKSKAYKPKIIQVLPPLH